MKKILMPICLPGLMFFILAMTRLNVTHSLSNNPDWIAESDVAGALLGVSVSTAGDVNKDGYDDIIIGASSYRLPGQITSGRAFVYYGSAAGLKNTPGPSPRAEGTVFLPANYGAIVASGDVNGDGYSDVFVASPTMDQFYGTVGVYMGSDTGIAFIPAITFTFQHARFVTGLSLASPGDVNGDGYDDLLVGNPTYQNVAIPFSPVMPRALAYLGTSNGISSSPSWIVPGGVRVAAAGDVNNDGFDDVLVDSSLYLGSATGLQTTPKASLIKYNAASAGDVNGDGYDDIIVGQPAADRAYLLLGCDTGVNATPAWTATTTQVNSLLGSSVAAAGDVNKDGYDDVIIGARNSSDGPAFAGSVYLYLGMATGLSDTAVWTRTGDQANANVGWSLGRAGDVNGDGFSDAIIGAPNYSNGEANEGRAFVYHGSLAPQGTLPLHLLEFTGKRVNSYIQLHWLTANEVNTCCFAIERSNDGISFSEIGRVPSKNNRDGQGTYSFNDSYAAAGKVYYRLKMIDADGKFTFSTITQLHNATTASWEIHPGMVVQGQSFTIRIHNSERKKNMLLQLLDMSGRTVLSSSLAVEEGSQTFPVNTNIPRGHYIARLTAANVQLQTKRITVR